MEIEPVKSDVGMKWEMVNINNLCRPRQWKTLSMEKLKTVGYPVYGANGKIGFYDEYSHEYPTLAITCRGATCGSVHITEPKSYINGNAMALDNISDKINIKFLFYYFLQRGFNDVISGSAQPQITGEGLSKIQIPLPPLPIQKRIAEILDAADALRRKDQELLQKYDELAQAIFIDMFGDPVKNEKGWGTFKFQTLGTLDRGVSKHRPRNAPELLGGDYPLIQTGDVANSGGIITKYRSTYSEIGLKQSKMWPKGTLCITIAANIAKTGILNFDACFPDSIVGFKPNSKVSNSVYIQYWIGFLQKILEDNAPESAQKNINLEILRGLDVISPPIELQNEFEIKIHLLNKIKTNSSNNIDESLFQTLLQKAFKGELVTA